MQQYLILSWIHLILSVINFALAAPLVIRERPEVRVGVVDATKDGTVASQTLSRWGPRDTWPGTMEKDWKNAPPGPESSGESAPEPGSNSPLSESASNFVNHHSEYRSDSEIPHSTGLDYSHSASSDVPYSTDSEIPYSTGSDSHSASSDVPYSTGSEIPYSTGSDYSHSASSDVPYSTGSEIHYYTGPDYSHSASSDVPYSTGSEIPYSTGSDYSHSASSDVPYSTDSEIPYSTGSDSHSASSDVPYSTGSEIPYSTGSDYSHSASSDVPYSTGSEIHYSTGPDYSHSASSDVPYSTGSEINSWDQMPTNAPASSLSTGHSPPQSPGQTDNHPPPGLPSNPGQSTGPHQSTDGHTLASPEPQNPAEPESETFLSKLLKGKIKRRTSNSRTVYAAQRELQDTLDSRASTIKGFGKSLNVPASPR